MLGTPKNPYFDSLHTSVASFWLVLRRGHWMAPACQSHHFCKPTKRGLTMHTRPKCAIDDRFWNFRNSLFPARDIWHFLQQQPPMWLVIFHISLSKMKAANQSHVKKTSHILVKWPVRGWFVTDKVSSWANRQLILVCDRSSWQLMLQKVSILIIRFLGEKRNVFVLTGNEIILTF